MKHVKNFGVLMIFVLMISCKCTKSTAKKNMVDYEKEGYTYGIIERQKTGSCAWIITDKENNLLDPVNIEDEKFSSFTTKKEKVYFKFLPLRRSNRCGDARPIELLEVIPYLPK